MVLVLAREGVEHDEIRLSKPVKTAMRELTTGYIKATDNTKRSLQVCCNFVDVAHDAAL